MMLLKCCTQYSSKFGKLSSGNRTGKGQFLFQCQRMFKLLHSCRHITCQQSNAQNSPTQVSTIHEPECPDVQAGFRKGRGTGDQIASLYWIIEKAKEFQKNIYISYVEYTKAFYCVDQNKLWKILKEMGIPDHLTCLLETCIWVKKQQLELDMKQQTGSKLAKKYDKYVYCHPAYLTYMQSTSCEMLA